MRISVTVKNRKVDINIDDDLNDVEISQIENIIKSDILRFEKENPDTISVFSKLIAKYAVERYLKDRKLKVISSTVEKKIDDLIQVAKDINQDNMLF